MTMFLLFESSIGYALFEHKESDEVGEMTEEGQTNFTDYSRFSQIVHMAAFSPYDSSEQGLENMNDVLDGALNDTLKNFLDQNVAKSKSAKKGKCQLGVAETDLGHAISESLSISVTTSEKIRELLRGIRTHFHQFVSGYAKTSFSDQDLCKAQLGLGHAFSRGAVKFNVNRADNMIIQSIALLDQLDKDLNTFSMRVREWYSWHFPELAKTVNDNYIFARLAMYIKIRTSLFDDAGELDTKLEEMAEICNGDETMAKQVMDAAKSSMGFEISEIDMDNIQQFAKCVVSLTAYRKKLHVYLQDKMDQVAPNLNTLVGEQVGARLIAHAGSLTSLAKYPASTVQILGAEKALFRALKTKGNTPKYGLIYHSSFIGRASAKNKGRISRYLANKCSIASRIDSFRDESTSLFGEKLKQQVEERLKFYDEGVAPTKNIDAMKSVIAALAETEGTGGDAEKSKKKKEKKDKKRKEADDEEEEPKKKKKKKDKQ